MREDLRELSEIDWWEDYYYMPYRESPQFGPSEPNHPYMVKLYDYEHPKERPDRIVQIDKEVWEKLLARCTPDNDHFIAFAGCTTRYPESFARKSANPQKRSRKSTRPKKRSKTTPDCS